MGHFMILKCAEARIAIKTHELIEQHATEISGNLILTIPTAVPYVQSADEYKQVEGQITFEGATYRMVKQSIHNDLRYIVCVKDETAAMAREEANQFIMAVSGQASHSLDAGAVKLLTTLLKSYVSINFIPQAPTGEWCLDLRFIDSSLSYGFTSITSIFHPPSFA
jgi:hypothetical protein